MAAQNLPHLLFTKGREWLFVIECSWFALSISNWLACMTATLWAKRGERDISRGARSVRRGEEKNKAPVHSPLFSLFRPLSRWCQKNQSKHNSLSRENWHISGAKRLHCSRNEELRLFPWLHELLPKFTGLNHLILYVDFANSLFCKIRVQFQFCPKLKGKNTSALGVRHFCSRRFKPVQ